MSMPIDSCLQCEQSRAEVAREQTICGIESGYEYRELEWEWPRHHWRDWSDAELRRWTIGEERWHEVRRLRIADLEWVAIEERCARGGHLKPDPAVDVSDRCARCYASLAVSEGPSEADR